MNDNLLLQYDEVVAYIEQYRSFVSRLVRRYRRQVANESLIRSVTQFVIQIVQDHPWSDEYPKNHRNMSVKTATDEEKQHKYFEIMLSEYTLDSLASEVVKQFPDLDYGKLKKLHELKKEQLARKNYPQQFFAIGLAASTILLGSVPEGVVTPFINYAEFKVMIFVMIFGTLAYLFLFSIPYLIRYSRARTMLGFVGDILTYITIKQGEKNS